MAVYWPLFEAMLGSQGSIAQCLSDCFACVGSWIHPSQTSTRRKLNHAEGRHGTKLTSGFDGYHFLFYVYMWRLLLREQAPICISCSLAMLMVIYNPSCDSPAPECSSAISPASSTTTFGSFLVLWMGLTIGLDEDHVFTTTVASYVRRAWAQARQKSSVDGGGAFQVSPLNKEPLAVITDQLGGLNLFVGCGHG